jgi:Transposase, Mutator family
MRKAKDNSGVPFRYFRPDFQYCPNCGAPLKRRATVQDKVLITLEGRFRLISRGYQCSRRRCVNKRALFVSPEPARLSLKGLSVGFDVLVQIGWWRFWEHRTLDEIVLLLKAKHLPISRRHILNLIGDFLALLRAAQPAKIEAYRAYLQRHGLVLSLDGMEPEQGNEMLFIVREANLDLTLVAETLYSSRADLISRQLLEPVKAFGFRIRAVVSDADKNIRRAIEASLPGCPHQTCQVHCLCEAGQPIFEADRAMKTDLRREIRAKLRPISRGLTQSPQDNPQGAVLMDYCEALRDALRADGVSPFKLAGLELYAELQRLETSLRRCQKKRDIPSCPRCLTSRSSATTMLSQRLN